MAYQSLAYRYMRIIRVNELQDPAGATEEQREAFVAACAYLSTAYPLCADTNTLEEYRNWRETGLGTFLYWRGASRHRDPADMMWWLANSGVPLGELAGAYTLIFGCSPFTETYLRR